IQPHPKGIELGILLQMAKDYEASERGGTLYKFLQDQFSRISPATASGFCEKIGVTSRTRISDVDPPRIERLFKEFQEARLPPPPTDCLAPIGVRQLLAGLLKGVRAEFYAASSREAAIYRGRPFQVEAAIAFGGELPADDSCRVIRFANRVPLLFQQSACSSFKAVTDTNWRNYDLQQPRGGAPVGPLVIMIHMASVWVPFTSESKEAIADYDEIRKEMKLALMECGRKLGTYLRKRARMRREGERRDIFQKYIGEIAKAANAITGVDAARVHSALLELAKVKTAVADLQLDQDGRAVKEDPADQEGVIVLLPDGMPPAAPSGPAATETRGIPPASARSRSRTAPANDDDTPPLAFSKAEEAALSVSARRGDEEAARPGRSDNRDGTLATMKSPPASKSSVNAAAKPVIKPATRREPGPVIKSVIKPATRPAKKTPAPARPSPAPGPKPKMRLVNGKLIRV
ncbi:MAG TPA: DNA topoisomerase VI subunit B, partial [Phycisphaerales bacterium]|nr:DNA topoisomerase VI subunit B [Phycisphaerales bacterium]